MPGMGCAWSDFIAETNFHPLHQAYVLRHFAALRAMRMGYNVLVMDSDAIISHDPYRYVGVH